MNSNRMPDVDELPPGVLHEIMQAAVAEGLLPPPHGYDANGCPVWELEQMAGWLGHTPAEARELLREFMRDHPDAETVDPGTIQRVN